MIDQKRDKQTSADIFTGVKFTLNEARILVVDDIFTNLKVAESLLAPYLAKVEICSSGAEAIEMVKYHDFDLIFMDQMMPKMDGIETVRRIRIWEKENHGTRKPVPIIALTANAVKIKREEFIEKGFNDFLTKPIDVFRLDEILNYWIDKKKKIENTEQIIISDDNNSSFPPIQGIDTVQGIALTGGKETLYRQVLGVYYKDAEIRLPLMQQLPSSDNMLQFVTHVHALKSASASIGAEEFSTMAEEIENACDEGNMKFVEDMLPEFAKKLSELMGNIRAALEHQEASSSNLTFLTSDSKILSDLAAALKSQNAMEIDRLLEEIGKTNLDSKSNETMEKIIYEIMMAEYANALEILEDFLERGR